MRLPGLTKVGVLETRRSQEMLLIQDGKLGAGTLPREPRKWMEP